MSQPLRILGISAFYHDSAAALLEELGLEELGLPRSGP
jgi:hypothetical protein